MRDSVVVAGAMAQRPRRAGHAWVFVNWMLGFRRLGFDVTFVDRIDESLGDVDAGVGWVREVMAATGFGDSWSVQLPGGLSAGLTWTMVQRRMRGGLLLNVMGYLVDPSLLQVVDRRVFLDIDPGFGQVWQENGLATVFTDHDAFASVGLNVGSTDSTVPTLGESWIPTFPAVDLDSWRCQSAPRGCFTTIASWRGPFAPIELHGQVHGLRVHEARKLGDLPTRTAAGIEVALDIDAADEADRKRLVAAGWRLRNPFEVAGSMQGYRDYIHDSLAEFSVAKEIYVSLNTGWFSDRSACYMASGRPVVVSDTGLDKHLAVGEGLLTYTSPDSAAAAIAEVLSAPDRHGKAARELAAEHFDAARVARSLLERAA